MCSQDPGTLYDISQLAFRSLLPCLEVSCKCQCHVPSLRLIVITLSVDFSLLYPFARHVSTSASDPHLAFSMSPSQSGATMHFANPDAFQGTSKVLLLQGPAAEKARSSASLAPRYLNPSRSWLVPGSPSFPPANRLPLAPCCDTSGLPSA